jgi:MFS family permease
MYNHLHSLIREYPSQFWLLFWGMLVSTVGASMIWPFLMIFVSERLQLPLSVVATLMTLNSGVGLMFSFIAGPIIDKVGRKWVMVISLVMNGIAYLLMSQAQSLPAFAMLMALSGAFNPLYRVGADAMMADLIQKEKRVEAYSILRMGNNVGVALGPAIGGFLATLSYTLAFAFAATGMLMYSSLVAFFARETLPAAPARLSSEPVRERLGGYDKVWRDRKFLSFIGAFALTQISAAIMWVLLSVYAKQNFQVPENQYGFIPTTNAVMVVLLQMFVTLRVKNRSPLYVLSFGAFIYAIGVGSVALGQGFWYFWGSMVVFTIGELILTPTATTMAANLAPTDMRGRYMSIYGLTWGVGIGIGPVLGGLLNDSLGPAFIWYGGMVIGLMSALVFLMLARRSAPASQKATVRS